jgi:cytidylate kinase
VAHSSSLNLHGTNGIESVSTRDKISFVVIAIDGPAGSGKSTVARELARRLGYIYVDTGAMYRAVALLALRRGVSWRDAAALAQIAQTANLRFVPGVVPCAEQNRLFAGEQDVTESIRTSEISQAASIVSTVEGVRHAMVAIQQGLGREGNLVIEGRDIGTVVFPNAEVKVFLNASPAERARRRFQEKPDGPPLDVVIAQIRERDARDSSREHSPLLRAPDAVVLDTTGMTIAQAVEAIERLALTAKGTPNKIVS